MQLSIIIVNYNVKYFLEHCLLSVIKACNDIEAEILVVDNNSTDGSKSYVENKFPTVKFYWLTENLGFGKANNYALQYAKGEHILFLNPDTIVGENCFTDCISFFKNHPDCGALGVRMLDGTGIFLQESKRGFPFIHVAFYKAIGLANIFPNTFGQYYATHIQEQEIKEVEVLAGAFMMLHKKTIAEVKGFDEDFFMYGEDIDLSYRIKKAGFENYYLGKNSIIHFKGESTAKKSDEYFDNFYGAMKRFADKHSTTNKFVKQIVFLGINMLKNFATLKNKYANTATELNSKNASVIGNIQSIENIQKILPLNIQLAQTPIFPVFKTIIESKNDIVIIDVDQISNQAAIEIIHANKNISFAFYSSTINTIIGSSDKNSSGFVFTKPQ
jgi:GT2 family glycosyltransferase